jgi:hypothetical protein
MSINHWNTISGVMMNTQLPNLHAIGPCPDHNLLSYSYKYSFEYEGVSKSFRTESLTKYMLITINTRWEATRMVMAANLTRLTSQNSDTAAPNGR